MAYLVAVLVVFAASSGFSMYEPQSVRPGFEFTVSAYNVENLFDTINDPDKDDEEYLPDGKAKWTDEILNLKLIQLAKVIKSMNSGKGPDILALPETENIGVLQMLNAKMPELGYQAVLVEGPDERGIDVGLLTRFPVVGVPSGERVDDMTDPMWKKPTRMVAKVVLQISSKTQLMVLLNRWPSRAATEAFRCRAGAVARHMIMEANKGRKEMPVLLLGDLNDEPENSSLIDCLGAAPAPFVLTSTASNPLFFDAYYDAPFQNRTTRGTYYFGREKEWNALDHIIMTRDLLAGGPLMYIPGSFARFQSTVNARSKAEDTKWGIFPAGSPIPFAVSGNAGSLKAVGASDHLPVISRFKVLR